MNDELRSRQEIVNELNILLEENVCIQCREDHQSQKYV